MGSATASENSSQTDLIDLQMEYTSDNMWNLTNSDDFNSKSPADTETPTQSQEGANKTVKEWEELSGCCSVLLHVYPGYDVFAYRRDSTYAAIQYIQHINWYGKEALKEFKNVQGYFFHTIVTADGWMTSMGGPDVTSIVNELESLAGSTSVSGSITGNTISRALNALQRLGMGHFLLKAPNGVVGFAIYNGGSKTGLFQMGNGQYVSVPNGPGYYRTGYTSTSDPVYSAFNLENSDAWGQNRRNIIAYEFFKDVIPGSSLVKVYAARTIYSDIIIFGGSVIGGLPGSPDRKYLGEVLLKYYEPTYFGYQPMIYMYSDILDSYITNGILPSSVGMIPWKILSDPNAGPFENDAVVTAAKWVKNYIDTNYQLPSTVIINGQSVSIYTYFYLASTVVQNIYSGNTRNIYIGSYVGPQATQDTISIGNMGIAEYINIADQVKVYMDRTGVTPGYAYGTSLGTYFGYGSMIYMYSDILDSYITNGILPVTIVVKPWKILSNPNAGPYTNNQVATLGTWVKNYVDTNHQLPSTVTIDGHTVSIYTYFYLASTVVQNLYNNNPQNVYAFINAAPQLTQDTISIGNMGIAEYINIADQVKVYMDRTGVTPGYAYGTSLGTYFGYGSMIYMYSDILDSYITKGILPTSISVKPFSAAFGDKNLAAAGGSIAFTNEEVAAAAKTVKDHVDTKNQLPDTVAINGQIVSIYTYLHLASTVIQNLYNNNPQNVYAFINAAPQLTQDTISIGNMGIAEYINIADQVKVYMDRTGVTPGYAYGTSLGTYFGYGSMIYMYSDILDSYITNGILPVTIVVKPWKILSNPNAGPYTNNQVATLGTWVKNYVDTNHQLPSTVTIDGHTVSIYTYFYLASTVVQNLYNNNPQNVYAFINAAPQLTQDTISIGNMPLSEYINIADQVKVYMDRTAITPGYAIL